MKKLLAVILALSIIFALCGCTAKTANGGNDNSSPAEGREDAVIDTTYYTVTVPFALYDQTKYDLTYGEFYNLTFYEKNADYSKGEFKFSICMLPEKEDYSNFTDCEVLGSLTVSNEKKYNVIVLYRSEPFEAEKSNQIKKVIDSITYKSGYTFSSTPIKVNTTKTISNKYFSITMPLSWYDSIVTENNSGTSEVPCALAFYEKKNHNLSEYGGFLFEIAVELKTDEEIYYPSFDLLGTIKSKGKTYNVVVIYPTDVQFDPKYQNDYSKATDQIESILKTVKLKNS